MSKYSVTYGRKVQTAPYQMMDVSLTMESDSDETKPNVGFQITRALVEDWIDVGTKSLE